MKLFYNIVKISGIFVLILLITFCKETIEKNGVTSPNVMIVPIVTNSTELDDSEKPLMEGIYNNPGITDYLGTSPFVIWNGKLLNIYTDVDYTYFSLKGGIRNDSLIFAGYSSDSQLNITLTAKFQNLNKLHNTMTSGTLEFTCTIKTLRGLTLQHSQLSFKKRLLNTLRNHIIIVHNGGGDLTYSPNSIGAIRHSGLSGANGMELDVNISKDGIPFLFHDPEFNSENLNSDFLSGPVTNFTFEDIRLLCLLPDGSKMPSLDEALNNILNYTEVKYVWLDIKNTNAIGACAAVIKKNAAKAASMNRIFDVYIGLPTQEAVDQYSALTLVPKPKILTELPPEIVKQIDADAWGPQWDNTINTPEQIGYIHSLGKIVFCWTIDDSNFWSQFTGDNIPDGIITNTPGKMIYEYIKQHN